MIEQYNPQYAPDPRYTQRPARWPIFLAVALAWLVGLVLLVLAAAFLSGFQRGYDNSLYYAHRARGDFDYAHGDYADAADEYGQMVALRPDAARGYAKRSDCEYEMGRYTAAIADDNQAIHLAQDPIYLGHLYYNRGNAYDARQDYPEAIADDTEALRLDPSDTDALRARIGAYQDARDYAHAIQDADTLIAPHPMAAEGYLFRAYVWRAEGDHARAAADYRRAMALAPDDTEAPDALAGMDDKDRRDAEAAQALEEEVRAHPGSAACWTNLGWWQYKAGQRAACMRSSRRAISLDSHQVDAWLNLGLCYAVQGDWAMAERTYTNVLPACRPEDVQAGAGDLRDALRLHPHAAAIQKSLALLQGGA